MEAFVTQLNIKVILVSPTNHKSLQAEHGIKSLSGLLVKHLSQVWSWHSCLPYSMLCYNGYSTPNLNGDSERSHNLQLTILYMSLKLPHFAHHNVVRSLTSRLQLCCIQYRMRGYGLISRANYKLVSHV